MTDDDAGSSPSRTLAPDEIAALEDERDHLLTSIGDLDREHEAGDVDDHDYRVLRDEYTARAARVIRSLEAGRVAVVAPTGRRRSWSGRAAWILGTAVLAVVAVAAVLWATGDRDAGQEATGDVRAGVTSLLNDAGAALGDGDLDAARDLYDQVLELQPSNAEALTYRGWSAFQQGDAEAAATDLADAVAADPDYPDARVFRAVVALRGGDPTTAAAELVAFDRLDAPPAMAQLVAQFGLRSELVGRLVADDDLDGAAALLVAVDPPELLQAVGPQIDEGDVVGALRLIGAVQAATPDPDPRPLAARGWVLALAADDARRAGLDAEADELAASAIDALDEALAVDAEHPDALAFRAVVRQRLFDDAEGAAADAAAYWALAADRPELDRLLDDESLSDPAGS